MKFNKALRVLLAMGLFQQAETQSVMVTVVESGSDVLIEWTGSLTALPTIFSRTVPIPSSFYADSTDVFVMLASTIDCTYLADFMIMTAFVVHSIVASDR